LEGDKSRCGTRSRRETFDEAPRLTIHGYEARLPILELTKREVIGFDPRIEKLNLELTIDNGLRLTDQLVEPMFHNFAFALAVNVDPVRNARRLSINRHAETHGSAWRFRTHDEVKIAGVKSVRDLPVRRVQ
jgi:hypothetical protein